MDIEKLFGTVEFYDDKLKVEGEKMKKDLGEIFQNMHRVDNDEVLITEEGLKEQGFIKYFDYKDEVRYKEYIDDKYLYIVVKNKNKDNVEVKIYEKRTDKLLLRSVDVNCLSQIFHLEVLLKNLNHQEQKLSIDIFKKDFSVDADDRKKCKECKEECKNDIDSENEISFFEIQCFLSIFKDCYPQYSYPEIKERNGIIQRRLTKNTFKHIENKVEISSELLEKNGFVKGLSPVMDFVYLGQVNDYVITITKYQDTFVLYIGQGCKDADRKTLLIIVVDCMQRIQEALDLCEVPLILSY